MPFNSNDLSSSTSTIDINYPSITYAKTLHKLKNVLNILQQHFFNEYLSFRCTTDQIDRSTTETMTPDSLIKSANDEVDSLNKNDSPDRSYLRNSARNINCNQRISDDDQTEHSTRSQSRTVRLDKTEQIFSHSI